VHGLSAALADLAFVEWLVDHVPEFTVTEHFVWITGWTSDSSAGRLEAALQGANVHALLRFSEPPSDITRPIVLRNPRWVQPFELFARLLGVPAANEADPSLLLALMTPLMFGFMFGDVGQGAVLVIAGVVLRRKYPATALLIPGGIAAMVFGALFGSVFAREDILPALWLRPMARPLTVLGVSLAGGCGVILLGFILDAAQHYWEGHARRWWATRAGLVLCYLGMVASVRDLRALWLMPAGLAWYWIGDSAQAPSARARRLGASVGESLETLLQLFVNSLSFVRVGAFALAHAGLAAAVSALSATISSRPISILALALGNALLIIIEGLIVGIQTTRLVLFEFFIRFLRGTGRQFHPLQSPPATDTMQPSRKFL
jgi:V/A-type H+-transporting ATPase subunit I